MSLEEHPQWHVTVFPAQWEYKWILLTWGDTSEYRNAIAKAGVEGWELVTVIPETDDKFETSVLKRPVHPGTKSQDNDASAEKSA